MFLVNLKMFENYIQVHHSKPQYSNENMQRQNTIAEELFNTIFGEQPDSNQSEFEQIYDPYYDENFQDSQISLHTAERHDLVEFLISMDKKELPVLLFHSSKSHSCFERFEPALCYRVTLAPRGGCPFLLRGEL